MNELPRDREIVVHCHGGQRSYFACRILSQDAFSRAQPDGIIPYLENGDRP